MELVNLHCIGAMRNCEFFELLTPTEPFSFGLSAPLPVNKGIARLPEEPGLGIEFDLELIDRQTIRIL